MKLKVFLVATLALLMTAPIANAVSASPYRISIPDLLSDTTALQYITIGRSTSTLDATIKFEVEDGLRGIISLPADPDFFFLPKGLGKKKIPVSIKTTGIAPGTNISGSMLFRIDDIDPLNPKPNPSKPVIKVPVDFSLHVTSEPRHDFVVTYAGLEALKQSKVRLLYTIDNKGNAAERAAAFSLELTRGTEGPTVWSTKQDLPSALSAPPFARNYDLSFDVPLFTSPGEYRAVTTLYDERGAVLYKSNQQLLKLGYGGWQVWALLVPVLGLLPIIFLIADDRK